MIRATFGTTTGDDMRTGFLGALAAGAAGLAISAGASAAVTYHYKGNPFDHHENAPSLIGNFVTATVTFDDSVVGYTGTVGSSSVLSWAIRIAQIPGSEMGSATGAVSDSWPLYFVFDHGVITAWQVLAHPAPLANPEIYTTHDSPYGNINPTADYYLLDRFTAGSTVDQPGVWAIPEPGTYLLMLAGLGAIAAIARRRRR
ncbi:MAG: PEP-CTERM sorting domain-containing protein [Burkholderiales bacterium]|nr:PEP-CTERM sorting domain-containing protein [Burkholderiales bacterium]